jgi:predicted RNA binding protein YcfA (HicA-like mRNA interferase family)
MPKLKVQSGLTVVKILKSFGFFVFSQRGSHIKVKRLLGGINQIVTVPNHKEIDKGTLKAIIRQASRFIPEIELRKKFYI